MMKLIMKRTLLSLCAVVMAVTGWAQTKVPEDATIESWVCSFVMHYYDDGGEEMENVSEAMDIAFSGTDVYFNLPNPIAGNTWVKGTIADNTATFAKGQLLGNYGGSKVYMVGQDEQGICDLVFSYNDEQGRFVISNMQLVLSASATSIDAWAYYTDMVVSRGGDIVQEDGTVAPPADAIVEEWTLNCRNVNPNNEAQYEEISEAVKVAFSADQIYIYGLCPANGWLKGVAANGYATFAARQFLGTAEGYKFYAIGYEGNDAIDIVFNYDDEQGILSTASYILMINEADQPLMELTNVVITRGNTAEEEQPVEAPAGLATSEYVFKATSITYEQDGSIASMEPAQWNVRIGFTGNDVYVQGFCPQLFPLAWVKGHLDEDDVTFANGQFYGSHPQLPSMKFYFGSMYFQSLTDMVMAYDKVNGTMQGGAYYLLLNSEKNKLAPYEVYAGVTISRVRQTAAIPATPRVTGYEALYSEAGYARVFFELPTTDVDGNAIDRSLMSYKLYYQKDGKQQPYVFTPSLYKNLTEDMEAVPYFHADGWDFYLGGSAVYLYESQQWQKIGVQTIYKVGNKTNESPIAWLDIQTQGIADADVSADVVSQTYTDLQGRPATASNRGIVICTQRLSNGTVRVRKILNKRHF